MSSLLIYRTHYIPHSTLAAVLRIRSASVNDIFCVLGFESGKGTDRELAISER
jgi:hypothetical protein